MTFYLSFIKTVVYLATKNPWENTVNRLYIKTAIFHFVTYNNNRRIAWHELMQRFLVFIAHLTCKIISLFFDNALENCSSYFYLYRLPE